jgi:hypothetical protein
MHFIESGDDSNPCRNATISNNDIGPCGEEGTDSQGNGLWADGISMACTNTMVTNNKVSIACRSPRPHRADDTDGR